MVVLMLLMGLYGQKAGFSSGVGRAPCVLALPFALIEYAKHEQNNKAAARQKVQQLQIQTAIVEQQLQLKTSKTKPQTPKNRITIPITIEENHRQSVHN